MTLTMMEESCTDLFERAQAEALGEREQKIVALYYGGSDRTLEEIAEQIAPPRKLTRARMSAILVRACYKIGRCAEQQMQAQASDGACAKLLCMLVREIRPGEPHDKERLDVCAPRLFPQIATSKARRLCRHLLYNKGAQVLWKLFSLSDRRA